MKLSTWWRHRQNQRLIWRCAYNNHPINGHIHTHDGKHYCDEHNPVKP